MGLDRPLPLPSELVVPCASAYCGRTPNDPNPAALLLPSTFGSRGEICCGHDADVEEEERILPVRLVV